MGFLLFNVYPAKVFMGDTGSLALGGFVAGSCLYASDAIVHSDRRTDLSGRSTFCYDPGQLISRQPMANEFSEWHRSTTILNYGGWSETRVVAVFSVITAVMCLIALLAL